MVVRGLILITKLMVVLDFQLKMMHSANDMCSGMTDLFTTILKLLQVNDTVNMLMWLTRLNILLDVPKV